MGKLANAGKRMMRTQSAAGRPLVALALATVLVAGCSGRDADLARFIDTTSKEPGGRVEPLPEVKPFEGYAYASSQLRSPFVPGGSRAGGGGNGPRPETERPREFLEQFSLDTMKMVGTLKLNGQDFGLVQVADGRVQRVLVGNHIGQNDGRITQISPSKISVTELVPDGLGGYIERPAAMALNE
jgi:type IV pilus assembly protein PilP